jgi:hypothetical protein
MGRRRVFLTIQAGRTHCAGCVWCRASGPAQLCPRCELFTVKLERDEGANGPQRAGECLQSEFTSSEDNALPVNVFGQAETKGIGDDEVEEFMRWRGDVDQEELLSLFDMALAWFSAKGHDHRTVCELARTLDRHGEGGLDDFFQPL